MIEDVIKVEFKVTVDGGSDTYMEKIIQSIEDYEAFVKDVLYGVATLDDIILNALNNKQNEQTGNTSEDTVAA
jgi:hypothetical protein